MQIGDLVIYVDSLGVERPALLTAIWGPYGELQKPSVNVVIVSNDEKEHDTYGRQIKRETSVVHQSAQPAHGNYWRES